MIALFEAVAAMADAFNSNLEAILQLCNGVGAVGRILKQRKLIIFTILKLYESILFQSINYSDNIAHCLCVYYGIKNNGIMCVV